MKKKLFNIFVISLIIILAMPVVCFASRHSANTTKLANLCEYYGWYTDDESFGKSTTSFTAITDISDTEYYTAKMKVKTAKKNGKYRSSYYVQGEKCSFKSIEKMLKKYSTAYGRNIVLSQKASDAIDEMVDYAEARGWVAEIIDSDKSHSETVEFTNAKYQWTATTIASRSASKKKVIISFKRDGKDSNKKAIKEWLEKYAITA